MKRVIQASLDQDTVTDISMKLMDVMNTCSKLEDYFWGNKIAEEFTKCYNYTEKALACIDRANARLND